MVKFIKWLRISIIILIIIIAIIIYGIYNNRGRIFYGVDEEATTEEEFVESYKLKEDIQLVDVRNEFYIVKSCVEEFYSYNAILFENSEQYKTTNTEIKQKAYKESVKAICNILDSEYIKSRGITEENILTNLENIKESTINITNMHLSEETINISIYIVEGFLIENGTQKVLPFKLIVKLDSANRTYSILPNDYVEEKYNIDGKINLEGIEVPEKIEKNENNQYTFRAISDEIYVVDLLTHYKNNILYSTEIAYEYLDDKYREEKFGSLEGFKQYVNENKERISSITLDKYQKTVKDNYTQYVCIDTNGNYYIFRETAVIQYKLLLDTYTIDIPEFTEKYNKANNENKVGMNIEKILAALNNKDYNYIYSKLADSFKNNYFQTVDSLKQYMEANLFDKNTIEYETVDNEGEIYMFDIQFNNAKDSTSSPVAKRIIMQLKEGTDFVFSFNVD